MYFLHKAEEIAYHLKTCIMGRLPKSPLVSPRVAVRTRGRSSPCSMCYNKASGLLLTISQRVLTCRTGLLLGRVVRRSRGIRDSLGRVH